jgi:hypothetical protein
MFDHVAVSSVEMAERMSPGNEAREILGRSKRFMSKSAWLVRRDGVRRIVRNCIDRGSPRNNLTGSPVGAGMNSPRALGERWKGAGQALEEKGRARGLVFQRSSSAICFLP